MTTKPAEKILDNLKTAISGERSALTIADAAQKSGLSLEDTKGGLNYLVFEYRGALMATSSGELLYSFPTGFTKPWEQREMLSRFFEKAKKLALGLLKFLVRAWITIVMLGYVVVFALILLALTFSKTSDREGESSFSGSLMFHLLLRTILDSLFWTFHPFSPFYVGHDPYYDQFAHKKKRMPFYEKVNRFFFGPEEKTLSETEIVKLALQEIRANKGRIGPLDLMRVTGLSKEEADPFMAKLMFTHDGDVSVSAEGGIIYEFKEIRKTALKEGVLSPPSIWERRVRMPAFTGNTPGSNILIASLNGFNLFMSTVAIANGWTLNSLGLLVAQASSKLPPDALTMAKSGTPLLLGWIPFTFSLALFLIPAGRALFRRKKKKDIDAKNGKRGLIRAILSHLGFQGISEQKLIKAWEESAHAKPDEKELTREIVKLGGELELDHNDKPIYKFKAIEAELMALENARQKASLAEASVGNVVFDSAR